MRFTSKLRSLLSPKIAMKLILILRLINGVGIIPAYVPLIIESDDMEPTKYYSLSAAAKGCGVYKQTIFYAYRNRCTRIVRRKGESKVFRIEWLD